MGVRAAAWRWRSERHAVPGPFWQCGSAVCDSQRQSAGVFSQRCCVVNSGHLILALLCEAGLVCVICLLVIACRKLAWHARCTTTQGMWAYLCNHMLCRSHSVYNSLHAAAWSRHHPWTCRPCCWQQLICLMYTHKLALFLCFRRPAALARHQDKQPRPAGPNCLKALLQQ